ncbi:hypothetical protein QBC42DRAFT_249381 [Cladorrhinum samala]|uniref:RING-type domain-containing protein n=1 Tax=Cladorrhinum samala TaxID=585594 RepID=A0AAV9HXM3_9PEZI|nr:hypothetical protein QBC42DRAFT_249381 [Cladorrhinum samala]
MSARYELALWPQIKQYLLDQMRGRPADQAYNFPPGPHPTVKCGICIDAELLLPGIPANPSLCAQRSQGIVLACGHMFCEDCYMNWQHHCCAQINHPNQPNPTPVTCPACRQVLHFRNPGCRHVFRPVRIPILHDRPGGYSVRDMRVTAIRSVPLTIPELTVSGIPTRCHECRDGRARLLATAVEQAKDQGVSQEDMLAVFVLTQYFEPEEGGQNWSPSLYSPPDSLGLAQVLAAMDYDRLEGELSDFSFGDSSNGLSLGSAGSSPRRGSGEN